MRSSIFDRNLEVVDEHFRLEEAREIERALPLYTDDVVWEAPARGLVLHGKSATAENYCTTFGSMADVRVTSLRRFASSDRVVDESIASFRLVGNGIVNAPLPVESEVVARLIHVFELRDGRIARESAYEMWRHAPPAVKTETSPAVPSVEPAEPSADRLIQLSLGFWGSKALLSAVELGVFTELAKGRLDGETLAQRLGLHPRSYRDFFDTLVALGMLERQGNVYSNAAETDFMLDRRKSSYIGGLMEAANRRIYQSWGLLSDALRTGRPRYDKENRANPFDALYVDADGLRMFLQTMTGLSMGSARQIARKFPWHQYKSFVDIGTAQGAAAVQIALAHPHIKGSGFDLAVVGPLFEEYVDSFELSDRVRFQAGNFFSDPLPPADVLLMGHILHDWNLSEKKMLIAKAYAALPKGGAIVVYEGLIDDERHQNAFGLLMSLNMLVETPGGFAYTGADCCAWLREAGFRDARVEYLIGSDSMVVGIK